MNRHDEILDAAKSMTFPRFNEDFTNQFDTLTAESLDITLKLAFSEGANWADSNPHWISVEDELPPCNEDTFDAYLVRTSRPTRSILKGSMYVALYTKDGFVIIDNKPATKYITHWMPLPKQPTDI